MSPQLAVFIAALAGAGLLAGFIGGLFGVGGGIVIVPALYYVFGAMGVDDAVRMHLSVGTSLASIIATSARSLSTHKKAGAVDMAVLRAWAPWISLGALAGAGLAGLVDQRALLTVFGAGLLLVAAQMGMANPDWRLAKDLPRGAPARAIGAAIGALSAMMGIGGGAFGVTVMTLCGRPIHQAVATASGFGAAIALPGVAVFALSGWGREGLAPGSLGFVNLPGFVILGGLTGLTAPIGARLAHRLDYQTLRRVFALFLALMSANMLRETLS